MEKIKHSLVLNLSNQANTVKCKRTSLSQFNLVTILGLEYLNNLNKTDSMPISFDIDEDGNFSINGIEGEINDRNIHVYTDKKVTESD